MYSMGDGLAEYYFDDNTDNNLGMREAYESF